MMRWSSVLFLFCLVLAGCGGKGVDAVHSWLKIETEFAESTPIAGDNHSLYISQVAKGKPFLIRLSAIGIAQFEIDGVPVPPGTWTQVKFDDLGELSKIHIVGKRANGSVFDFADLFARPKDFPKLRIEANNPADGQIYLAVNKFGGSTEDRPSFLTILDKMGDPIFIGRRSELTTDFKRFVIGADVYYAYFFRAIASYEVMDSDFQQLDTVALLPYQNSTWQAADLHELLMLDVRHYVVPAYVSKTVTNDPAHPGQPVDYTAAVFQEIVNGQVVFQWDSTEHPELYAYSTGGNQDYAHLNSIEIDPNDGNFIVSFRHLDAVIKIHRTTGAIIWILGGPGDQFGMSTSQNLSHQHDARMSNTGELTLFDNGNAVGHSRALRMTLNESAKTITTFEEFLIDAHFSVAMGSTQFLDPSTLLVGWGYRSPQDSDVTEWSTVGGIKSFELWLNENDVPEGRYCSYRAKKYPPIP